MLIQTPRLDIHPLTRPQLELYLAEQNLFEQTQGLQISDRVLNEDIKGLIRQFYLPSLQHVKSELYLYYTVWIAIDRALQQIVAEFGFKGAPARQSLEIGYDTFPPFQQQGYICEAIRGVATWLHNVREVHQLTAETHYANIPSIRVLEKCRFAYSHSENNMLYWKLKVKPAVVNRQL
ncbi:GNAT family N-acetyltransferase [Deminuibacter soli]|uniref:N-acetyltransferase n=1 Tax=Deminuibacter soli TaxID=2291815 RepID=A0A3E1NM80_9BACT|nr:GNAT family N-acetyltransferase [Deminuibacter soli]RFM28934.1 N-acetyltransferase [Deminuibacter soli]